jgi:hypothetical protein
LPAPVSEKKVEKLSSEPAALSEGRVPSGWRPGGGGEGEARVDSVGT